MGEGKKNMSYLTHCKHCKKKTSHHIVSQSRRNGVKLRCSYCLITKNRWFNFGSIERLKIKKKTSAIEIKRIIRKTKDKCVECGKVATSYYEALPYCQKHYPKPKKETNRGRLIIL